MEDLKIEDVEEKDEYVPEDPNAPVDDFEISDIEIESYMPEELKTAIRRYNEIHKRTVEDLMNKEENDDNSEENIDENIDENDIVEDENNNLDLKNIF